MDLINALPGNKTKAHMLCRKYTRRYNSDSDEIEQYANITAMQSLNENLQLTGESPIKKKRPGEVKYPTHKIKTSNDVEREILNMLQNVDSSVTLVI
jgi:hypothetical protein